MLGASVSAPRLNPSKKLRSSQQHISSPEPPSDDDEMATNEPPPDASGVDIDADGIELGRKQVAERGLANVELELHPAASIRDAVRERRLGLVLFC